MNPDCANTMATSMAPAPSFTHGRRPARSSATTATTPAANVRPTNRMCSRAVVRASGVVTVLPGNEASQLRKLRSVTIAHPKSPPAPATTATAPTRARRREG